MVAPIHPPHVTQRWGVANPALYGPGRHHQGVDFGCPVGTPVHACANGLVIATGSPWGPAFGNDSPLIRHKVIVNGKPVIWFVIYAHMSHCDVRPGQIVVKGQLIGKSGAEGHVTGPHLHLEAQRGRYWRINGDVDPDPLIRA